MPSGERGAGALLESLFVCNAIATGLRGDGGRGVKKEAER
jgi:hypothetical protein